MQNTETKKYDSQGYELYPDSKLSVIEEVCDICKKKFKWVAENPEPRSIELWVEFYYDRPELGMYLEQRFPYHGLCFWQNKLAQQ